MKAGKLSFFVNLVLVVVAVVLFISALSLPYMVEKTKLSKTEITLTKLTITTGKVSNTVNIKDMCHEDSDTKACKLYKGSDALITLTTFGMGCLVAAGVLIVLGLFCSMGKKFSKLFNFAYLGTTIAGFVLFLVSFIEYTVIAEDILSEYSKYGAGWILYLVSMIISFVILAVSLVVVLCKDGYQAI